jgi:pimeloyl-ACP methyl ester carboxylesterase
VGDDTAVTATSTIYRDAGGRDLVRRWCDTQLAGWAVDHDRQVVEGWGGDTHLVRAGDGPLTVVSVAGDRFSAAACLPLLTVLARRYQVVAADVPGQPGLSAEVARGARGALSWYGCWLADVIDRATTGPVMLVGHSFGGAITLVTDHPRVHGRVAVATGGLCRPRLTPGLLLAFIMWAALPRVTTSTRLLRALSAPRTTPRPALVEWMTLVATHTRPVSSDDLISATPAPGQVLVATGDHDLLLPPKRLAPAAQRLLGADLTVIPHAGHLVVDDQPDRILDLVDTLCH